MLLCFGSRRRNRNHQIQWSEKDRLLDDQPRIILNPYCLDEGKQSAELALTA